jgi:hypothetical protein
MADPIAADAARIDRWLCGVRLVKVRPLQKERDHDQSICHFGTVPFLDGGRTRSPGSLRMSEPGATDAGAGARPTVATPLHQAISPWPPLAMPPLP